MFGEDGWQLKECVIVGRGDKAFVEDGGHQEKLGFKLSTNLVANFGSRWRWLLYEERIVRYSVHFSMEERLCLPTWVLPDAGGVRWLQALSLA